MIKKIIIIFLLIILVGCSVEKEDYSIVEKEEITGEIEYTLEDSKVYTVEGKKILLESYFVKNPTSGNNWEVEVYRLNKEEIYPGLILTPGGKGGISEFSVKKFSPNEEYTIAEKYASEGFVTLIFGAEGRSESEGEEDYNGYIDQDGLYQLYRFLDAREDVNNIGFVSFSYGVAMVSGMLGRYQVPAAFYIEWEGPVDRYYVTVGCRGVNTNEDSAIKLGISCSDDEYWSEREALRFVPYFKVNKFMIIQSKDDHVQSTIQHSVDINNLAIKYLDYVIINNGEINVEYTVDTLPVIEDKEAVLLILDSAKEFAK